MSSRHNRSEDWFGSPWSEVDTRSTLVLYPPPSSRSNNQSKSYHDYDESSNDRTVEPCVTPVRQGSSMPLMQWSVGPQTSRDRTVESVTMKSGTSQGSLSGNSTSQSSQSLSSSLSLPSNSLPSYNSSPTYGAIIVETRSDVALKLEQGAMLPFMGGLSSTDNKDFIIINAEGNSFTVLRKGMYRIVLDAVVMSGAPSVLKIRSSSLPDECQNLSQLNIPALGPVHASTMLAFGAKSKFEVICEGTQPLTLGPGVRMQVYTVG